MTLSDHEPQFQNLRSPSISSKANISQTVHLIHSMFGSRLGFSGSADRMALFPAGLNSNKSWVGKHGIFSYMRQYLENGRRYDQSYIIND